MKLREIEVRQIGGLIEVVLSCPNGEHVIAGGPNGAGKSSLLKAVARALGGARGADVGLRDGAEKGSVALTLTDGTTVRWSTTRKGDALVVAHPDGSRLMKPQELLSRLWSERCIDPLALVRAKPEDQAKALARACGVDLVAHKATMATITEQRRAAGAEAKRLHALAGPGLPHPNAPEVAPDVGALMTELFDAQQHNREVERRQTETTRLARVAADAQAAHRRMIEATESRVAQARWSRDEAIRLANERFAETERHEQAKRDRAHRMDSEATQAAADAQAATEHLKPRDEEPIRAALTGAQAAVEAVRANAEHRKARTAADAKKAEWQAHDDAIAAERKRVAEAVAAAKLPGGLALVDGEARLGAVPLSQASTSEQIRAGMALALSEHPELAVVLVDGWHALDEESRSQVLEMADAAGCQVLATVVGNDPAATVRIVEGRTA
jgi:ABC-type ATPase involved in cell division